MKIREIAAILIGAVIWAAITTALGLPPIVAFIGGLVIGWGVARYFGRLRG